MDDTGLNWLYRYGKDVWDTIRFSMGMEMLLLKVMGLIEASEQERDFVQALQFWKSEIVTGLGKERCHTIYVTVKEHPEWL